MDDSDWAAAGRLWGNYGMRLEANGFVDCGILCLIWLNVVTCANRRATVGHPKVWMHFSEGFQIWARRREYIFPRQSALQFGKCCCVGDQTQFRLHCRQLFSGCRLASKYKRSSCRGGCTPPVIADDGLVRTSLVSALIARIWLI